MSERGLRTASAVLALVGASISAYLLYVRQTGGTLVCATGGCETVQDSSYAEVLGIPVAALGMVGFLGLFAAAVGRGEWARLSQATLALAAFFFSVYLLYVQLAIIGAICQWCIATDLAATTIAGLALIRLRYGRAGTAQPGRQRSTGAQRPQHPQPRPNRRLRARS